ncbi:MAG: hypothetical protein HGA94_01395, partial [Candidatus Aminicenantes bacterium]|nr:hypothetical protein [Candidatus Aminicenantes bacterium]
MSPTSARPAGSSCSSATRSRRPSGGRSKGSSVLPKINAALVEKVLVRFIRDEFGRCGCDTAILGLSGGLDSAVCAALAARALGPRNVLGLIMPYGKAFPQDVRDAGEAARRLGI